jgi:short subunit dehydrogenase-like uncharacterized protein
MTEKAKPEIVLYGAYGYTGQLIAEMAAEQGYPLLLSGRNEAKLKTLSESTGHPWQAASLDQADELDALLRRSKAVIHAAGPFVDTFRPMAGACLRTGIHYLDITGEIAVFEALAVLDAAARESGIMLMPGTGFDVVPTDCLAATLKQRLPDATHLDLAFRMLGNASHGTASTMVRSLGEGSLVRREGRIVPVPAGRDTVQADFGKGPQTAYGIPWGDVSTAWHTTGIPNITTYVVLPKGMARMLRLSGFFGPLLRSKLVRGIAQRRIDRAPAGPDAETRRKGRSEVWGRARNAAGEEVSHHFACQEGYTLTALAALLIAKKVASGNFKAGFQTPGGLYGPELLNEATGMQLL